MRVKRKVESFASILRNGGFYIRRVYLILLLSILLQFAPVRIAKGEDHVDYKFENYQEEDGRIRVQTHSALFKKQINSAADIHGEILYDTISGATPTGAPPQTGSNEIETAEVEDTRIAGVLGSTITHEVHTFAPELSYSVEDDYESIGASLTYSLALNKKNTALNFGAAFNHDKIIPNEGTFIDDDQYKNTVRFLVGVNQLLGPKTVLTVSLTLGNDDGYLNDPYKGVAFDEFPYFPPYPYTLFEEKRPGSRFREVTYVSVKHYLDKLNASVEGSYRFHHDSWDINAHTLGLEWNQKIGEHFILTPAIRYHYQSGANFYGVSFPGDPTLSDEGIPDYYSADFRLSELQTLTYGLNATFIIKERLFLDLAYKRYDMQGLDGETLDSVYPDANVITAGLRLWF